MAEVTSQQVFAMLGSLYAELRMVTEERNQLAAQLKDILATLAEQKKK